MELLLIPVLLLTGAALLHLGVNGGPSFAQLPSLSAAAGLKSVRVMPQRMRAPASLAAAPEREPQPDLAAIEVPTLELADVLLADLLTEMMQFKEDLAALRAEVELVTSAAKAKTPDPRPKRAAVRGEAKAVPQ